jgi:hypothetical protein
VLVLIAFYDLEENSLLTFNGLFWILYVTALANIEILAVEHKRLMHIQMQWSHDRNRIPMCASAG